MKPLSNAKTVLFAFGFSIIAGMLLFLVCFNRAQPDIVQAADKNDISYFKDFKLSTPDNSTFETKNLSGNKITVFNGWAPWCTGCVKEMPDLEKLSKEYAGKGLQIVGIVPDYPIKTSSESSMTKYNNQISSSVESTGVTYPILLADSKFYNEVYPSAHGGLPTTWVVDSNGNILKIISGAKSESEWIKLFDEWLSNY